MIKHISVIFIVMLSGSSFAAPLFDARILKEGDIIFQESQSRQSRALKLATKSRYTHVAILFKLKGEWYVEEAVQPVKYTVLSDFIRRGKNFHYVIKRLKNADEVMTVEVVERMKRHGKTYLNKNYDLCFGWDDSRIYCSELVWKLYKEIPGVEVGKLERLKDFDLSSPLVKKILRERYGERIPYEEPVISPQSMFESDTLKAVTARN